MTIDSSLLLTINDSWLLSMQDDDSGKDSVDVKFSIDDKDDCVLDKNFCIQALSFVYCFLSSIVVRQTINTKLSWYCYLHK